MYLAVAHSEVQDTDITVTVSESLQEKLSKYPELGLVVMEISEAGVTLCITWPEEGLENYPTFGAKLPQYSAVDPLLIAYQKRFPYATTTWLPEGDGVAFRIRLLGTPSLS